MIHYIRLQERISELECERDYWKANHDNQVAKLRLFTQRKDLPVDRLPAYRYTLSLESRVAELELHLSKRDKISLTDEQIAKAVHCLYANDTAAKMGLQDDILTARVIERAIQGKHDV